MTDENNREYETLTHETKQKNCQGGPSLEEAKRYKRMHATGDSYCRVQMLWLLIKKTTPKANALYNSSYPKVIRVHKSFGYSFDDKPIKRRTFVNY